MPRPESVAIRTRMRRDGKSACGAKAMVDYLYRIHPAIGIARSGTARNTTSARRPPRGFRFPDSRTIRHAAGFPSIRIRMRRSPARICATPAARSSARPRGSGFFQYPAGAPASYPGGQGTEIQIGSTVNGKTVKDIIWTVHVANKKANTYVLVEDPPTAGIVAYENGNLPPLRNKSIEHGDPNNPKRITMLTIDAGPRAIAASNTGSVRFDRATPASIYQAGSGIVQLGNYPKSFPADSFSDLYCPTGPIDTLGELRTDTKGRLLVLGGYGRACGWGSAEPPLGGDVTMTTGSTIRRMAPYRRFLLLDDDSVQPVQVGAWAVTTDPSYAPQTLNIVSLWDDMYDTWVRALALAPALYDGAKGGFQASYQPSFADDLAPIFQSVALQQWNINLNGYGIDVHNRVGKIEREHRSGRLRHQSDHLLHPQPERPTEWSKGPPLMPGSLGDSNQDFLVISKTQYFFLQQWQNNAFTAGPGPALGRGNISTRSSCRIASADGSARASI
jgi:hypothetical protein